MNKTTKGLVLTLLSALLAVSQQAWGQTTKQTLFKTDNSNVYRIPSIVRLLNGNLWAMCDLRYGQDGHDIGMGNSTPHRIDVVGRLSTDNGVTWETQQDIAKGDDNANVNDGSNGYDYAHGDPASVVDRESGKILVMSASGLYGFNRTTNPVIQVGRSISMDGGTTWNISNVSSLLYQNDSYVQRLFFSSGKMIQSTLVKKDKYYRIYAAVDSRPNGSCVVYSDDFGETWSYLGGITTQPASGGDECKVEELPNGNIVLSCRSNIYYQPGRWFNLFTFTDKEKATGSWGTAQMSGSSNTNGQTYAAGCNGEILLVPAKRTTDNKQVYVLLQSAAMSSSREKVGIYYKVLESDTDYDSPSDFINGWSKYQISNTTSCYSTMVLNKDGDVAFLFEEDNTPKNSAEAYNIKYMTLPLSTITGGAYTYSPNTAQGGYHVTSEPTPYPVEMATPTFSVASGTYTSAQQVEITSTDANVTIYYTTDGSEPTTGSTKYTGAITVDHTMTLKAIAVSNDDNSCVSQVATATYKVQIPDVLLPEAPTFSVASGTYTSALTVELKTATDGATLYYTTDGSEPSESSSKYTSPITVDKSTVVKAIAVDGEGNKSKVVTAEYSIVSPSDVTKIGTTISLDYGSSHRLFSSKASGDATNPDKQYFGFLRHDIAHVQIITSNDATLSTGGDEVFNENDNDMLFEKVGDDTYLSFNSSSKSQYVYAQVVAPKGYRIMRYQMAFDADNSASGSQVTQYTYDADGNVVEGASAKISDGSWDQTLANGTNMLFFRFDASAVSSKVMVKSIHITYAIDQPITGQVPNENGDLDIHTGLLDLGTFSKNSKDFWSFSSSAVTDQQDVTLMNDKGEKQAATCKVDNDQYLVVAANGDYYLEAPEKFRIVGATLQFLRHSSEYTTKTTYEDVTTVDNGDYIITDGKGNYLNLNGSSLENGTNANDATVWTLSGQGSNKYQIKSGSYYLVLSISGSTITGITVNNNATYGNWLWDSSNYCFKASSSTSSPGYLSYNNGWNVSNSTSYKSKLQKEVPATTATRPASDFTATVYDREGKAAATGGTATVTSTNSEATLTVDDYNNDAIRFNISGLTDGSAALYRVNLKFLPLNPEVQTLQVAAKYGDGVIGSNRVTSTNYTFHDGEAVRVLVPKNATSPYTLVFRNAENEEKSLWYTNGVNNNDLSSTGGYSNFTLVGSSAYDGDKGIDMTATPWPTARINADQAGTNKLLATNIQDVVDGKAEELQDMAYKKGDGGLQAVSLANGTAQTVYVYSADMPTWNILPSAISAGKKHIDYRFYTIKVMPVVENEKPEVTFHEIYKQTLKAAPHKTGNKLTTDGGKLDNTHTYVGVTVTSTTDDGTTPYGVLTNTEVISAIKSELANKNYYGFDESDPLRSILYVDMSALNTVTGETTEGVNNWDAFNAGTADNCLYFMPVGFTRNVENTISKRQNGSYEAVGNIRVYDQQPFFTPYAFTTGTRQAIYNREATDGLSATVQNMTAVLPFSVQLTSDGHVKTATDATDNSVQFHDITGYGKVTSVSSEGDHQDLTYAMLAEAVKDGVAKANQPYYVTSTTPGFTFNILGAQFEKTPGTSSDEKLKRTQGNWTAIGTYAGVQPTAGEDNGKGKWYFSKDFFWNAAQLRQNDHFNIRPFRAYYRTTDNTPAAQSESSAKVVFDPSDITTTGISDIHATEGYLVVTVGHGYMTLTATAATRYAAYTVGGQLVARGTLAQGDSHTVSVPAGVYVVNNQKVVVK